jgi:nucleotide-binding universal stress UspA family protein
LQESQRKLTYEKESGEEPDDMNNKHILLPVDLVRSPCHSLVFAREMAAETPICVTLLYVLNLNIVTPTQNIYDELRAESEAALRALARFFFGTDQSVRVVVRIGAPEEEILAEARAQAVDLIVLPRPERRKWNHWWRRGTAQKVVDAAPCPAVILPPGNCQPARSGAIPAPASPLAVEEVLPAA